MDRSTADLGGILEIRSEGGETASFHGIASTDDIDLHDSVIEPGCFLPILMRTRSGATRPDVQMLRDHDDRDVVGGWTRIEQDGKALLVEGELALDVPKGRETYTLMKRGFLSGLSMKRHAARMRTSVSIG